MINFMTITNPWTCANVHPFMQESIAIAMQTSLEGEAAHISSLIIGQVVLVIDIVYGS